jgi:hypothetical protein
VAGHQYVFRPTFPDASTSRGPGLAHEHNGRIERSLRDAVGASRLAIICLLDGSSQRATYTAALSEDEKEELREFGKGDNWRRHRIAQLDIARVTFGTALNALKAARR